MKTKVELAEEYELMQKKYRVLFNLGEFERAKYYLLEMRKIQEEYNKGEKE